MRILVAVGLLVGGCDDFSTSKNALNGIYNVETWTFNAASCDAEGASIKDQEEPVFFVKYEVVLDYRALNVRTCADLASCQTMYADDGTIHISRHSFVTGNNLDGWTDVHGAATVQPSSGMCEGENIDDRLVGDGADGVRIETRATHVAFAPTATNECTDEASAAAAVGLPCSNFEVVVGRIEER